MDSYLMEDVDEGKRIISKTNAEVSRIHLTIAGLSKGMQAIEIGCASGEVTREMARIVDPIDVIGFDLSEERIEESKQIDADRNIKNIRYKKGTVYQIDFQEDRFDFVWSRFLFEYLKKPIAALKEMVRIAKPGGLVAVADLDGNCIHHYPMEKEFQEGLCKITSILKTKTGFDPHVGRKLFNYFVEAGLENIKVDILPYHLVYNEPDEVILEHWVEKMRILELNFKKIAPGQYPDLKFTFSSLIDHIKRKDVLTYSVVFLVRGQKKIKSEKRESG